MDEDLALKPISGYDPDLYTPAIQKKEYSKTWVEWAADNFEQVIINSAAVHGTTIFTVPVNKILYITSAYVTGRGVAVGSIQIGYLVSGGITNISNAQWGAGSGGQAFPSFPMPLKIESKTEIKIYVSGANSWNVGLQGFLVPFKT